MKPKTAYLVLAVIGTVLPYTQFLPFLRAHGLDLGLFVQELFSTRIGAFFGLDVLVSAIVLIVFVFVEGRRARRPRISGRPSRPSSPSASRSAFRSFSIFEKERSSGGRGALEQAR